MKQRRSSAKQLELRIVSKLWDESVPLPSVLLLLLTMGAAPHSISSEKSRAAAATAGGKLPALHAVAEHGNSQPVGQVLRKFLPPLPEILNVLRAPVVRRFAWLS